MSATTKAIDRIANLGFGALGDEEAKEFPVVCDKLLADRIEVGLTMEDVLRILRNSCV